MKKIIIAICVAVALIITGIVATVIIINTPSIIIGPTISSAFADLSKRNDVKQIQGVLENGSLEFDMLNVENGTDISGKIYFNLDDNKFMAENIDIKHGDISLSGSFYLSNNFCYVQNDDILGGAVGIKAGSAADQFEKSIFAFGSGSEYAVDRQTHDIIYEILSAFDDEMSEDLKKDSEKLRSRYLANLQSGISKYGKFSSKKGTVKVGDVHMNARTMTVAFDEEALISLMTDFLTFVAEDEKLKEFVYTYGDKFDSLLASNGIKDAETLYKNIIDGINGRIKDLKTDLKGNSIELSVVTPKLSTKLLSFTFNINDNGDVTTYGVDFGPDGVKNSDLIRINLNGTLIEYKRNSDNKSFSIVVEDFAKVTYHVDSEGGFELALLLFYENEERYEISGSVISDKNTTFYDITNYKYTYNKDGKGEFENVVEKDLDIYLKISKKDKMPPVVKEFDPFFEIDGGKFALIEEKLSPILNKKEEQ